MLMTTRTTGTRTSRPLSLEGREGRTSASCRTIPVWCKRICCFIIPLVLTLCFTTYSVIVCAEAQSETSGVVKQQILVHQTVVVRHGVDEVCFYLFSCKYLYS
jgi:hypothetical protein